MDKERDYDLLNGCEWTKDIGDEEWEISYCDCDYYSSKSLNTYSIVGK